MTDSRITSFLFRLNSQNYLDDSLRGELKRIVSDLDMENTLQSCAEYWKAVFDSNREILVRVSDNYDDNYAEMKDCVLHLEIVSNCQDGEVFVVYNILMDLCDSESSLEDITWKTAQKLVEGRNVIRDAKAFLKDRTSETKQK